jgi:thymidine kinase
VGIISTRIGLKSKAIVVAHDFNLFKYVKNAIEKNSHIKCILIDEAQFLTKTQIKQLCLIADKLDIPVLAYGLRTDYRGEPFEGSQYLLALADLLIELKTICHCGRKATMNLRIDAEGNPIRHGDPICIGGNERYIATCRKHFYEGTYAPIHKRQDHLLPLDKTSTMILPTNETVQPTDDPIS